MKVQHSSLLTPVLDTLEWPASRFGCLTLEERARGTHPIGERLDPETFPNLCRRDHVSSFLVIEPRFLRRPSRRIVAILTAAPVPRTAMGLGKSHSGEREFGLPRFQTSAAAQIGCYAPTFRDRQVVGK